MVCSARCERAYMLALFTFIGACQSMNWYLLASVPDVIAAFYNLTKGEADALADLTLNWGAIIFCVVLLPATWSISMRGGLRRTIRVSRGYVCSTPCSLVPVISTHHRRSLKLPKRIRSLASHPLHPSASLIVQIHCSIILNMLFIIGLWSASVGMSGMSPTKKKMS